MTEEPYRKMSSNQEFHKTKFQKKNKKKNVKRQRQSAASAVKCEI